jgi:hypothetical protein
MKFKLIYCFLSIHLLHVGSAFAAVTLNLDFGSLKDSTGDKLPDSTLVVLIANTDMTLGALPGGLTDRAVEGGGGLDPTLAFEHFKNKQLAVGQTINSDKIIYVGEVNGLNGYGTGYEGIAFDNNVEITIGAGVSTGQSFGLYWFPGLTINSNTLGVNSFEIGGFYNSGLNLGDIGMEIPGDGLSTVIQRDSAAAALDGASSDIQPVEFNAINAIPEPSSLVLTLLGSTALLRRRRA